MCVWGGGEYQKASPKMGGKSCLVSCELKLFCFLAPDVLQPVILFLFMYLFIYLFVCLICLLNLSSILSHS